MATKYTMYVQVSSLHVRQLYSTTSKSIGGLKKNDAVTVIGDDIKNTLGETWVKIQFGKGSGYVCKIQNGKAYLASTKVGEDDKPKTSGQTTDKDKATEEVKEKQKETEEEKESDTTTPSYESSWAIEARDLENPFSSEYVSENFDINDLLATNIVGIHGMPYQFMPIVDMRLKSDDKIGGAAQDGIGRIYAEKVVSKMPLVLLTPGVPIFLEGYSQEEREGLLDRLINYADSGNYEGKIESIIKKPGRYYTFKFDYGSYYDYVEPMLYACAQFLGLENKKVTVGEVTGKLGSFQWRNANNQKLAKYVMSNQYVPFYVDSQDSVSESFSTDTTQSQLASSMDSLHAMANEVMFITGTYTNMGAVNIQNMEEYNAAREKLDDLLNNSVFKNSKLINSIADAATTIAAGGKLFFPEIWSDTTFSKSYALDFKLRTPDGDSLSWYMNICVPLIHLIGFAAPRELSSPNMYISPMLVRGYYKGIFNIDMGIVTGLDISKGKEGSWTIDGLPTEVDVHMELKDLYSVFSMTDATIGATKFVKNIGMIDYLASMCGLNINKPELTRSVDLWLLLNKSNITNYPNRAFGRMMQAADNYTREIYERTFLGK